MNSKIRALKKNGTFNPNWKLVRDDLFLKNSFFDPNDIMQVKYEMLRKIHKENIPVINAAKIFGMTRQNYYKFKNYFESEGIVGLKPQKRGPKQAYKLTQKIITFIEKIINDIPKITNEQIVQKIETEFKVTFHTRTIERYFKNKKKQQI